MDKFKSVCSQSEHTSCYTYFRMTGDFDPDVISELLGLVPESSWKRGDARKDGKSQYDFSFWQFGTCWDYDVAVENQMLKTITPLLDKVEVLREIKARFAVDFTLEIVPTVRADETTPCLAPSMQVMRFCCDTGTEIDIDLYVADSCEFERT